MYVHPHLPKHFQAKEYNHVVDKIRDGKLLIVWIEIK